VVDSIRKDTFCPDEPGLFVPIAQSLLENGDPYLMLADFEDYVSTSFQADELYLKPNEWDARVVLNIARSGKFSADRSIAEYARDIWKIEPVDVSNAMTNSSNQE
jgi:starch phosphorylase